MLDKEEDTGGKYFWIVAAKMKERERRVVPAVASVVTKLQSWCLGRQLLSVSKFYRRGTLHIPKIKRVMILSTI